MQTFRSYETAVGVAQNMANVTGRTVYVQAFSDMTYGVQYRKPRDAGAIMATLEGYTIAEQYAAAGAEVMLKVGAIAKLLGERASAPASARDVKNMKDTLVRLNAVEKELRG
jgi:hypothetical protein